MELLKEYSEKYGLEEVLNDYGEHRQTRERSIVFPNGWVVSIVENNGIDTYKPNGEHIKEFRSNKKYSVAMCDYNGYFDWDILNKYGAIDGCIYCDDELEILVACETIRRLWSGFINSEDKINKIIEILRSVDLDDYECCIEIAKVVGIYNYKRVDKRE